MLPDTSAMPEPVACRCGGKPVGPTKLPVGRDFWMIECSVERCYARNIALGRLNVIHGWNRLSSSLHR